jgi:glucokinase
LSAELLNKEDVVIAISSSGRSPDLLNAVDLALEAGASVIAITASKTPLAKRASVTLAVDHDEDSTTYIAMISRILHLLMIDVLAVGVAIARYDSLRELSKRQRGGRAKEDADAPLSSLISHTK